MRLMTGTIAILLFCGAAQGSSFVTVDAPKTKVSSSFVYLDGSAETAHPVERPAIAETASIYVAPLPAGFHAISPSMIAMDTALPVTPVYMASAIDQPKARRRHEPILVIRGGVVGGGAPAPTSAPATAPTADHEEPQQITAAPKTSPQRRPYIPPYLPEPAPPPPLPAGAYGRPQ